MNSDAATPRLSISELVVLLNRTLELALPQIVFEGEISEIKQAQSGHLYFRLKDERSQIDAVMWAGMARGLGFKPEPGGAVLCVGKPNVYQVSGRLQIVVHKMQPAGFGILQKKFLELKQKLEKEGFFAQERKRPLPFLPKAVGVVTSKSGAVIHDIMVRIQERMPSVPVYLVDVRVQGPGAADEIAAAIRYLDSLKLVEVIITGRGGGSLEDLWAFNEEVVVKAIFSCRVPVVSAVGHETDVSLADLVADRRAPTPTAAAEMVVPRKIDLEQVLNEYQRRLFDSDRWLRPLEQRLDELESRLDRRILAQLEQSRLGLRASEQSLKAIEPGNFLSQLKSRLIDYQQRLDSNCNQSISRAQLTMSQLEGRIKAAFSIERLGMLAGQINICENRLLTAAHRQHESARGKLEELAIRLDSVSPRRVLERGYSIVETQARVIRSAAQLKANDRIKISFFEGVARAEVLDVVNKPILAGAISDKEMP